MNAVKYLLAALSCALLVAGCGGGGGGGEDPEIREYRATITGINVVRVADKQPVSVSSLPIDSATVKVR